MSTDLNGKSNSQISISTIPAGGDDGNQSRQVFLEYFTMVGSRLVTGRPSTPDKAAIIGLLGFAERLRDIWKQARTGNPYARWWLLKVEAAEQKARERIGIEWQILDEFPHAKTPLILGGASCKQRLPMQFACPYAYRAAFVLKLLDELADALLLAIRIGVATKSQLLPSRIRAEKAVRHLFASVLSFHPLEVKDQDVIANNDIAGQAKSLMGAMPESVLQGSEWPELLELKLVQNSRKEAP